MMDYMNTPEEERNIAPFKLLFECFELVSTLVKCLVVMDGLPLKANSDQSCLVVYWLCSPLDVILCISHAFTQSSQCCISWIVARYTAVSKLLFKCSELATALVKALS